MNPYPIYKGEDELGIRRHLIASSLDEESVYEPESIYGISWLKGINSFWLCWRINQYESYVNASKRISLDYLCDHVMPTLSFDHVMCCVVSFYEEAQIRQ